MGSQSDLGQVSCGSDDLVWLAPFVARDAWQALESTKLELTML